MQSSSARLNPRHVRGWIFDLYPSEFGEMTVWIIAENGERVRLTDRFKRKIYVSGREESVEKLASQLYAHKSLASWDFDYAYASSADAAKSKVLKVELKDCRAARPFTRKVLKMGRYFQYQVHNCDLSDEQAYLSSREVFPLALVEVEAEKSKLSYVLLDSADSVDYRVPPFRTMTINVEFIKKGKIAKVDDPIDVITINQENRQITVDSGNEKDKLLHLVHLVKELDPDIILTKGGDSYLFAYLAQRAAINGVANDLVLSRDETPLAAINTRGRTYFSYGRTFYRATTRRLYGRVHIDANNTFILSECGLDGLIEIARTCRVPLHKASRSSIGSSMSSLQFYQALKDGYLIPRNKGIPEAFKSAYELLVGDRGGFVYEPQIGLHEGVCELDFASMYPALMVKNNISAETVLCKCCPDSRLRIPDLGYSICEKRSGIVPKSLKPIVEKRLSYQRLRDVAQDPDLKESYDNQQGALKWILVTCFGYLGYRNARFGTVDGHIGVCAFGRDVFLKAARIAEEKGFTVVHGIVDSLWIKKENATKQEYLSLCREISEETSVPLNFEGRYKWIVFLPSKLHPNVGVMNRYYGVFENNKLKARGLEVRRRDTPRFVHNAQMEMLKKLAGANNRSEFLQKIPDALKIVREYRQRLLAGETPIFDLIITKHMSKSPERYKQKVSQVIAAEQLAKEGFDVPAGKNVRFLFTSAKNRRYERRVKAEKLMDTDESPDVKQYLLLLYNAAANLLSPFGYLGKEIYDSTRGYKRTMLEQWLKRV